MEVFDARVCSRQVVCETGLGVNGMTLTSLRDEGYKAVFIGIGACQTVDLSFRLFM